MLILSKVFALARTKPLLLIGNILLGIVLSVSGLAIALYYSREGTRDDLEQARSERVLLNARLMTAEENNLQQQETIKELHDIIMRQDKVTKQLASNYKGLSVRDDELRTKIRQLEVNNDEVSAFLNRRVPNDLRSLLNAKTDYQDRSSKAPVSTN